jgi:hypothetical protein
MEGISPFQSGRPLLSEITADKLNRILAEIKRNRPVVAAPLSARVTGDGTHISIKQTPGGGGTSTPATFHPFQITSFADPESNPESPSYLVTLRPGTINNLLPTNILDDESLATFALPANNLQYVVLSCTAASNALTSCEIALESSPPSAQTPLAFALPTTYEVTLGIVYNTSVYQIVTTNLSVGSVQACITDKANPTPGSLPYNVFLQWG